MKITNIALIGLLLSTSLFAQRDRRMEQRDRRMEQYDDILDEKGDDRPGRMEMYAIWKLTENLNLDEKQAEVFFPKLNSHKAKMREMGKGPKCEVVILDCLSNEIRVSFFFLVLKWKGCQIRRWKVQQQKKTTTTQKR